jgi:EAL domain-containing protein (putative c-di-GMP-specific phosphodiesterase class I)
MPIQRTATPDREIVEAIISLAHRLGMNVIAEGVETVDQQTVLSGLNCQFAQGFLFARPLNKVDAGAFIRKGQRERASKEERRSGTR